MKFVKDKDGKEFWETEPGFGIPKRNLYTSIILLSTIIGIALYLVFSSAGKTEQMYQEIFIKLDDPQYVQELGCAKLRLLTQMDDKDYFGHYVMNTPPSKELMDKIFLTMKNTNCPTYDEQRTLNEEIKP